MDESRAINRDDGCCSAVDPSAFEYCSILQRISPIPRPSVTYVSLTFARPRALKQDEIPVHTLAGRVFAKVHRLERQLRLIAPSDSCFRPILVLMRENLAILCFLKSAAEIASTVYTSRAICAIWKSTVMDVQGEGLRSPGYRSLVVRA